MKRRRFRILATALAAAVLVLTILLVIASVRSGTRRASLADQAAYLERIIKSQRLYEINVECRLTPEPEWRLDCHCNILAAVTNEQLALLLNPGLTVASAQVGDMPVDFQRRGDALLFQIDQPGDVRLRLHYGGALEPTSLDTTARRSQSRVVSAPYTMFWHPLDLTSFAGYSGTLEYPPMVQVVAPDGARQLLPDSSHRVTWRERRAVLGVSLAAATGAFESSSQIHGGALCQVHYVPGATGDRAPECLDVLGRTYNMMRALQGEDGFAGITAVIVPDFELQASCYGGNSLIFLTASDARKPWTTLAPMIAKNWWTGTVSGTWIAARPDGATFINDGISRWLAWVALERLHGPSAILHHKNQIATGHAVDHPLRIDSLLEPPRIQPSLPMIAATLAADVGEEHVLQALRLAIERHRYSAISLATLEDILEQTAETDLDEFTRVWFDRPGRFDYAVRDVTQNGDTCTVYVENTGNVPVFGPLSVLIVTNQGAQTYRVDAGPRGTEFATQVDGRVLDVVLDPDYVTPDVARENNLWPRRQWPQAISVERDGSLALWIAPTTAAAKQTWRPMVWRPEKAAFEPVDPRDISEHGLRGGAFIDEFGQLNLVASATRLPRPVTLPGLVRDAAWQDDKTLFVLVLQPIQSHAGAHLGRPAVYRVNAQTGQYIPLAIDIAMAIRER